MCRVLGVSPSAYYRWRAGSRDGVRSGDSWLLVQIRTIYQEMKRRYGSPRIHQELRARGVRVAQKRVARLMRQDGLRARQARKFKVTTDSEHEHPVAPNVLDRDFEVEVPNARWCADITYIWTSEGWLYLAVVMDLFSRRIVGWQVHKRLARSLVIAALKAALADRRPGRSLLHHSDRGSQYASSDYQEVLSKAGCVVSMSRKGDCWDNAPMESFFATLKKELVHGHRFRTREDARREIFEFIEVWYNRKRRHSSLGYQSPAEYEEKMLTQSMRIAA